MRVRHEKRLSPKAVGALALLALTLAFYGAFAKGNFPWQGGYELTARFATANNISLNSPVRIAGVNVGKITDIQQVMDERGSAQQAAIVRMKLSQKALPIHRDAKIKLRPRLFLEGNFFLDLKPGSPSEPELPDGGEIAAGATQTLVQIDQVLTSLQSDTRKDLQSLLRELGGALEDQGGAEGLRQAIASSAGAFRTTSQVNEALLGTEPHDLSGFVENTSKVLRGLGKDKEDLADLVSNLATTTGAFGDNAAALERGIAELDDALRVAQPALDNLNAAFPSLRAFAKDALPGTRNAGPALDAATPWLDQLRLLVGPDELRGLVNDLRPLVPDLARLSTGNLEFFEQVRAVSSCFSNVVIPWGNLEVPDEVHHAAGPISKETGYGLVGLAGESRGFDANGPPFRVQAGGGANTVLTNEQFGLTDLPILGAMPTIESSAKTPFKPDQPCEVQDVPNLAAGGIGSPPAQQAAAAVNRDGDLFKIAIERATITGDFLKADQLRATGEPKKARLLARRAHRDLAKWDRSSGKRFRGLLGVGGKR